MAGRKDSAAQGQFRLLMHVGAVGKLTDGQLLERFSTGRGDAAELAFAALVERHGPMVWRLCRGVLADPHTAEDAFQATFMVLVKKAGGLWVKDSLGAWLHQVAFRTASSALKDELRRRRHERRAAEMAATSCGVDHEGADPELERLLHAEIDGLPERYRVPIVLCDLEGYSHELAARHLGWPIGTVKSRLARGRDRLRDRLRQRGVHRSLAPLPAALWSEGSNPVLPTALVRSTTILAMRFGVSESISSASVASLVQGVLETMSINRWLKVAAILLVAGATASSAGMMSRKSASGGEASTQKAAQPGPGPDEAVAVVKQGKFTFSVVAPGSIEAERRVSLLCEVAGRSTIISIVPEGKKVKKGDLLCELDSASLRDQLVNQRVATRDAEMVYQSARESRESAELAIKEYEEGTYPLEKATIEGEIRLAESAVAIARAQMERTRRLHQQLNDAFARKEPAEVTTSLRTELELKNQLDAAEQTLMREQLSVQKARGRLNLLENYTKGKMAKELKARADERRFAELVKERAVQLEHSRERSLGRQITRCKLIAPGDGTVVYANDPHRAGGWPQIEEGATVRERQIILYIDDLDGPMQVNAKAREAYVDRLARGQKARIEVDAFPGKVFSGEVVEVAPLPDPGTFFNSDVKVYTTRVRINGIVGMLRPGMTARAEILVSERDNALTVPIGAVLLYDARAQVAVKKPAGEFEWREVILGESNDVEIEVKQGLKPGEQVALAPMHLLTEQERLRFFPTPPASTPPATSKTAGADRTRAKAIGKEARGARLPPALIAKLRSIAPEDRARLKNAGQQEREAILRKAGFTDAELSQFFEMTQSPRRPD